ncbi:CHAP domain-containing protein [Nisaea sp.]|uniref:CHAP domain-containing protein n=1 Tax=Nisaea sp. TaxID=2024842 RepID=UPI003B51A3C5
MPNALPGFGPLPGFSLPDLGFDGGGNAGPAHPSAPRAPSAPKAPETGGGTSDDEVYARQSRPDGTDQYKPSKGASAHGRKAVTTAEQEFGAKEEPKGSNGGPEVDPFTGGRREAWCCHFVSWCVEQHGTSPFGHLAWVEGLRRWGKKSGSYFSSGASPPVRGDIFLMARYDRTGKLVGGHTGFVTSHNPGNETFDTIEGNTSDRVDTRTRRLDTVDGFIRL